MAKAESTKFVSEKGDDLTFNFVCECEDCVAEGELILLKSEGMKPFGCPEGCGATYVPWNFKGRWLLKCVVLPQYFPRGAEVPNERGKS